jgi:hypothetical protein
MGESFWGNSIESVEDKLIKEYGYGVVSEFLLEKKFGKELTEQFFDANEFNFSGLNKQEKENLLMDVIIGKSPAAVPFPEMSKFYVGIRDAWFRNDMKIKEFMKTFGITDEEYKNILIMVKEYVQETKEDDQLFSPQEHEAIMQLINELANAKNSGEREILLRVIKGAHDRVRNKPKKTLE